MQLSTKSNHTETDVSDPTRFPLSQRDMPTHWYNINADLPTAGVELPPLSPQTGLQGRR